jgi:phosphatidylglycerol:prolipoprotein diacylglycerol transferase
MFHFRHDTHFFEFLKEKISIFPLQLSITKIDATMQRPFDFSGGFQISPRLATINAAFISPMYPILGQLGPFIIYSLWIFVALGFFASLLVLHKLIHKDHQKLSFIAENSLFFALAGLLGARLVHVLRNFDLFFGENGFNYFQTLNLLDKGLSFWGGMMGVILTILYLARKQNQNLFRWLDILSICVMTGLVFGNLGSFFDGRNYGSETTLPWGVTIESSRFTVPIHPTQAYSAIYTLLLTLFLFKFYRHKIGKKEGNIALFAVCGYSFFRFLEEFLRGDESFYFQGFREFQIYSLIAFLTSAIFLYLRFKKKTDPSEKDPETITNDPDQNS